MQFNVRVKYVQGLADRKDQGQRQAHAGQRCLHVTLFLSFKCDR
jgi:hypothetical protein